MAKKTSKTVGGDTTKIDMSTINETILIKDICKGYVDNSLNDEGGITSMDGRLNIRPRYQRTYIVEDNKVWKENLINSILCGYPINRIYIGVDKENTKDKSFSEWALEMLDGQQRTITICKFINDAFSIKIDSNIVYYSGLSEEYKNRIMNYPLDATYCIGNEEARIKWFKRINQPNSLLTDQELRNSTYIGTFTEDAKKYFCATSSRAIKEINDKEEKYCITRYTTMKSIERCDFLEVALDWASYLAYKDLRDDDNKDERICRYMAQHQHDENANELINTYKTVIDWVVDTFWNGKEGYPSVKTFEKVEWGRLYSEFGATELTPDKKREYTEQCLEIGDPNTPYYKKPHGVYEWVLRGSKDSEINTYLEIMDFSKKDINIMYAQQNGIDPIDGKKYSLHEMDGHHIISRRSGGMSTIDNCVLLSKDNHHKLHADSFMSPDELRNKRDELRKENGYL